MISLAVAIELDSGLAAMNPPRDIMRAGKDIIHTIRTGGNPPRDLMNYVQAWIGRQGQQNRYGQ